MERERRRNTPKEEYIKVGGAGWAQFHGAADSEWFPVIATAIKAAFDPGDSYVHIQYQDGSGDTEWQKSRAVKTTNPGVAPPAAVPAPKADEPVKKAKKAKKTAKKSGKRKEKEHKEKGPKPASNPSEIPEPVQAANPESKRQKRDEKDEASLEPGEVEDAKAVALQVQWRHGTCYKEVMNAVPTAFISKDMFEARRDGTLWEGYRSKAQKGLREVETTYGTPSPMFHILQAGHVEMTKIDALATTYYNMQDDAGRWVHGDYINTIDDWKGQIYTAMVRWATSNVCSVSKYILPC
jgi:hypothetical protein